MNIGKTLFALVMEFVPWKTFGRIVDQHKGDAGVRTLGCSDVSTAGMLRKVRWVLAEQERRLAALGFGWRDVTATQVLCSCRVAVRGGGSPAAGHVRCQPSVRTSSGPTTSSSTLVPMASSSNA